MYLQYQYIEHPYYGPSHSCFTRNIKNIFRMKKVQIFRETLSFLKDFQDVEMVSNDGYLQILYLLDECEVGWVVLQHSLEVLGGGRGQHQSKSCPSLSWPWHSRIGLSECKWQWSNSKVNLCTHTHTLDATEIHILFITLKIVLYAKLSESSGIISFLATYQS